MKERERLLLAGGQLLRNAFQPNPPLYINDTTIEMAMVVVSDLRDFEHALAAFIIHTLLGEEVAAGWAVAQSETSGT